MKLIILHLSDFHCKNESNPVLKRPREIAATLNSVLPDAKAVFIVFTGDIAYSGKESEYLLVESFIHAIETEIKRNYEGPIHFVITPGNHDVDFASCGNGRNAIIDQIRQKKEPFIDNDVIAQCTAPQKAYFDFEKRIASSNQSLGDPLWKEYLFKMEDQYIAFSAPNVSWTSQIKEEPGRLVFPARKYEKRERPSNAINIMLLHHPLHWYSQDTYHPLRELARDQFQFVMSGHEHVDDASVTTDKKQRQIGIIEAPALYAEDESSAFSILKIDLSKLRFASETFAWSDNMYLPESGNSTWETYLPIPQGQTYGFHISPQMMERIQNVGARFSHPNTDSLQLSDVFVFPDMTDLDESKDSQEYVRADILLRASTQHDRVLIYGDDHFGKTSLLNQLFLQLHSQGSVPTLFDGKELGGLNEDQFLKQVRKSVEWQYGEDVLQLYEQTERKVKVALVDNLDQIGVRGDLIAKAVELLVTNFDVVIATVGERFEVALLSSVDAGDSLSRFSTFRLSGFGYKLRNHLIRRWYQVGRANGEEELQEKVHSAESLINTILGKGLVPMTAFNVLVLLQTIEINEKSTLANAGLAQYYEFLIRRSLSEAKVRADEFDEYIAYLSHLAWEMYSKKIKRIDDQAFASFNIEFSAKVYRTNLAQRIATLKAAKIIDEHESQYAFAFPYVRYFFIAKYLSDQVNDSEELRDLVKRICRHLYIKENANIVLFLTHHNHAKWIVQEVVIVLNEILADVKPLNISADTTILNSWVNDKARLVIDTSDLETNQEKMREKQDHEARFDQGGQELEVESLKELDQLTQLNLLFKTSEILGQILKSRYGSILADERAKLIEDLMTAPLRATNFFFQIVNDQPQAILLYLTDHFQTKLPSLSKEKAGRVAQRFIFATVGAVADSFLSRQGEIIGSPKLQETIDLVSASKATDDTYRLVSIAAQLSYPNNVPTEAIKRLSDEFSRNYFGYKILQGLAARHMYMYALPVKVRQALSAAVGIDVQSQRDIESKSRGAKKLPSQNSKIRQSVSLVSRLMSSFAKSDDRTKEILDRYVKPKRDKKPSGDS